MPKSSERFQKPWHILWGMFFLKIYPIQDSPVASFNFDKENYRKLYWVGIKILTGLKNVSRWFLLLLTNAS